MASGVLVEVSVQRGCRRAGEHFDLRTVIVEGFRHGHASIELPSVTTRTKNTRNSALHARRSKLLSEFGAKCHGCDVVLPQKRPIITKPIGPVRIARQLSVANRKPRPAARVTGR